VSVRDLSSCPPPPWLLRASKLVLFLSSPLKFSDDQRTSILSRSAVFLISLPPEFTFLFGVTEFEATSKRLFAGMVETQVTASVKAPILLFVRWSCLFSFYRAANSLPNFFNLCSEPPFFLIPMTTRRCKVSDPPAFVIYNIDLPFLYFFFAGEGLPLFPSPFFLPLCTRISLSPLTPPGF